MGAPKGGGPEGRRGPRSLLNDGRSAPSGSSGTSSSLGAKNKIVQFERVLEAMGGMEGPAVQAIKMDLEKARLASEKPRLNV